MANHDDTHPEHPHIGYAIHDHVPGVATVLFDRPDKLNALTSEMVQGYLRTLRRADDDPRCRLIVVTGAGRGFCAGADTSVLSNVHEGSWDAAPELPTDLGLRLTKPVIAAVNGHAIGLGFVLMLGTDIRFAADSAPMSAAFSRLGLVAEYASAWLLPRLIGAGPATELLLSSRSIEAAEAKDIGLVHEVVPADDLLTRVYRYAEELASNCSPHSISVMKQQLLADHTATAEQAMRRSLELMADSFHRPDLAEALAARNEKRPPRFPSLPR